MTDLIALAGKGWAIAALRRHRSGRLRPQSLRLFALRVPVTIARSFREWWYGPYTCHGGKYPQVGIRRLDVFTVRGFSDPDEAAAEVYRRGWHWYIVRDRLGREVRSSDADIAAIRANPPRDSGSGSKSENSRSEVEAEGPQSGAPKSAHRPISSKRIQDR